MPAVVAPLKWTCHWSIKCMDPVYALHWWCRGQWSVKSVWSTPDVSHLSSSVSILCICHWCSWSVRISFYSNIAEVSDSVNSTIIMETWKTWPRPVIWKHSVFGLMAKNPRENHASCKFYFFSLNLIFRFHFMKDFPFELHFLSHSWFKN